MTSNPFAQINSVAISTLAERTGKVLCELRQITSDWRIPFNDLLPVQQSTFLIGAGKINAYFDSFVALGAEGVGAALIKMEFHGVDGYMNGVTKQLSEAAKDNAVMRSMNEALQKRRGEWKEPEDKTKLQGAAEGAKAA